MEEHIRGSRKYEERGQEDLVCLTLSLWGTPAHGLILFLTWASELSFSQSLSQSWCEETSQPKERERKRESSSPSITTTPHPLCNLTLPWFCTSLPHYTPYSFLSNFADMSAAAWKLSEPHVSFSKEDARCLCFCATHFLANVKYWRNSSAVITVITVNFKFELYFIVFLFLFY